MKLSDYVADFLADLSPRIYGVVGAGAMHLNDSICNHPRLNFIATHHEQAAAMAAEADARVSGKIGLVHVTAGPGGTNAITGIAGAWVDSIPMLVIAGQVTTNTLKGDSGLRQLGTNELGLVEMVRSITKYAVTVTDPKTIRATLERAVHEATTGRPGPCFVEIPLDVQAAQIEPSELKSFAPLQFPVDRYRADKTAKVTDLLNAAKRPLIIVGNGVRLAGAQGELRQFVCHTGIPVVTSWNASDLFPSDNDLVIGRPGIMGDRTGNFAVQSTDVILAIGTRLSVPQIGHAGAQFAPQATLIHVDIDFSETQKTTRRADVPVTSDAKVFLRRMLSDVFLKCRAADDPWRQQCLRWKQQYLVMRPQYRDTKDGVNSYHFVEELGRHLDDDAIVVTDVGAAFISTMQSLQLRGTQRLFHSGGVSAMGYGIPAAIGACLARHGRQTVCLVGDGGAMLNLQELQTIAHHRLPIVIFVFVNGGYLTMQFTQATHFKREAASSPRSGLSCPDFVEVAKAFRIESWRITRAAQLEPSWSAPSLDYLLSCGKPILCEIHMPKDQLLIPRVQSKVEDGKFVPVPIEDMWPYLDREELRANMAGVT